MNTLITLLTDKITPIFHKIGTKIYNRGDMANLPHTGKITKIVIDKWGSTYTITPETERKNDYEIPACMVKDIDTGNGFSRIVTMAAHNARNEKIMLELASNLTKLKKIK